MIMNMEVKATDPVLVILQYVDEGFKGKKGIKLVFELVGTDETAHCFFNIKRNDGGNYFLPKHSILATLLKRLGQQEPPSRYMRSIKRLIGSHFTAEVERWDQGHDIRLQKRSLKLQKLDLIDLIKWGKRQQNAWQNYGNTLSEAWQKRGKKMAIPWQEDGRSVADGEEVDMPTEPMDSDDPPF